MQQGSQGLPSLEAYALAAAMAAAAAANINAMSAATAAPPQTAGFLPAGTPPKAVPTQRPISSVMTAE